MVYRPLGFGSHHWEVVDAGGRRWFVTVDELETKRHSTREPLSTAFNRLRAALTVAGDLRDCGRAFVVAPVPTLAGEPVARLAERFAVAVYPFVEGRGFGWGDFGSAGHREVVLGLVVDIHTAPAAARRRALVDDFGVPHRDDLEAALDPAGGSAGCGPYAARTAALLADHAAPVRRLLARYDALVAAGRARPDRMVLTHGEPHPGNTMRTPDGWRLIDWDTAMLAPPERDLWLLDPGDGSVLTAYADATGVPPLPAMLDLYRIRWDLADVAVEVSRFRRPHAGTPDDDKAWEVLRTVVTRL